MAAAIFEESGNTYTDFVGVTNTNFTSTFVTGPIIPGQGDKSIKLEYVTVYANDIDDGSIYMRCRWDWADDVPSSKWSTEQQCYTFRRFDRDVSRKRLLVRGQGPAIQFAFRSEDTKPFEFIGWTIFESIDGVA